jgi:hypothetical protein
MDLGRSSFAANSMNRNRDILLCRLICNKEIVGTYDRIFVGTEIFVGLYWFVNAINNLGRCIDS